MKLLLELLKKILSRLSNSYTKEETDGALSLKIGVEEFDDGLAESSDLRASGDSALIQKLEANKANDDALANVVKWKTYAIAMQKMVDENLAMQIAEEFEKAAVEYLKDPTATKDWRTVKNADGTVTSTNPYYGVQPVLPIIDFNVVSIDSTSLDLTPFNVKINVPIFLPSSTRGVALLRQATLFNSALIFPNMGVCSKMLYGASSFNQPLSLPKATLCNSLLVNTASFNQPLSLPLATDCSYMLSGAISFNSTLDLPNATNCSNMLRGASAFNQPLSLPKATNCMNMFYEATSFNQPLDLPSAGDCSGMLQGASAFNQPLSLPKATNCNYMIYLRRVFNNVVNMPSCKTAVDAFRNAGMSAENISKTLDSLPTWTDGASRVITFTGCPGIASTATMETFTVTDEDGTEYSMENCPIFDTDDELQTLRKAFVLAVMKKGWTVEMTEPIAKWHTYMLEKAALTGDSSEANVVTVNRAMNEFNTNGSSALASRLYEDWVNLYVGYESWIASIGEESQLDEVFWTEYFVALSEWEVNPTATVEWTVARTTNDDGTYTYSSNCPYFSEPATAPIVNFSLTKMIGYSYVKGLFSTDNNVVIYAPNVTGAITGAMSGTSSNKAVIVPSVTSADYTLYLAKGSPCFFAPNVVDVTGIFQGSRTVSPLIFAPSAKTWTGAFRKCATNTFIDMRSASTAVQAFEQSKMSAENISATLDSLPTWTDGASHVIMFTGSPGAAELTQESPSVAAAIAKGWTVEL